MNFAMNLDDLIVDISDPRALNSVEITHIQTLCSLTNMAIYRSPVTEEDKSIPRLLGQQLGIVQLDANWLADEDGISQIAVAAPSAGEKIAYIPYTNRPLQWHTDGYYHPEERRIQSMILHCVRPAATGGDNAVMDHAMAYQAMLDANPAWIKALMQPDAMTIPARLDEHGIARPAQTGPVFSFNTDGSLHMRYTARTRSIEWKNDPDTRAAVAFLETLLARDSVSPHLFRFTLQAGMGIVCNNVLHDRSGFVDCPNAPRLLYRARFLDRIPSSIGNAI